MFVIEVLLRLPVLTLSPVLAVAAGMVFVFKAGILSGRFYVTAAGMFLTAGVMAVVPQVERCPPVRRGDGAVFPGAGDQVLRVRRRAMRGGELSPARLPRPAGDPLLDQLLLVGRELRFVLRRHRPFHD